jgi:hypothetical protein
MSIRFAASEPATNKALQEVGFLGGFGLFSGSEDCKGRVTNVVNWVYLQYLHEAHPQAPCDTMRPGSGPWRLRHYDLSALTAWHLTDGPFRGGPQVDRVPHNLFLFFHAKE